MINRKDFYASVRTSLFKGKLQPRHVQNMEAILNEAEERCLDLRQLAYILGTIYWETGRTMAPVEEIGKGRNYDYGKKLDMGQGPGKRIPYLIPDKIYYGRGHSQVTWLTNYKKLTVAAKAEGKNWDFVNKPELLLEIEPSVWATFYAMTTGLYTGKKLSQYFNSAVTDWVNSRKIVNGLDKAAEIAEISKKFYAGLTA